jgi:very-short-patch-repair endonuclease
MHAKTAPTIHQIIDALAAPHGVVSRDQLVAAGFTRRMVERRVRIGHLKPVGRRGVYLVGPLRSMWHREAALILSAGCPLVLSHGTAVRLWGIAAEKGSDRIEATTSGKGRRSVGDAVIHRVRHLSPAEITCREGLPVTSIVRTILDVGSRMDVVAAEQMIARAERANLTTRTELTTFLASSAYTVPAPLRWLLTDIAPASFTRSEAEAHFLALVRKAELPKPETNVRIKGLEVDALWRSSRLIVEIDGHEYHSSGAAFHNDRRRDAVLIAAGYRVMRITWRHITGHPEATIARLAQALARA